MKIAIANQDGDVAAHFGRCPSYTIIDVEDGRVTQRLEVDNPGHQPGFLPRFLAEKGVNCIIAGGMGPRAQNLFADQGIQTVTGIQGSIDDVIEQHMAGRLQAGEDMCGHRHGDGPDGGEEHAPPNGSVSARAGTRICISSEGRDLNAAVDPRFGRAPFFMFLDPVARRIEVLPNPHSDDGQGAGIQAARFLSDKNVSILLTGQVGPNAEQVLKESGIQVVTGVEGRIRDVIQKFAEEVK